MPEGTAYPSAHGTAVSQPMLIRGGYIADVAARRVVRADVLVEGGRVRSVIPPGGDGTAAQVIDASGCLVIPGLINAHSHSYSPLVRHVAQGLPLEPWMMYCWANTIGRTPEETYLSATLQGIEALKTGTTTVLDHLGGDVEVMSAALRAYFDLGIRAVLAPMVSDISMPDTVGVPSAQWPPDTRADDDALAPADAAELLGMSEVLHADWHGRDDRLSVFLGPSGPQRCSIAMLEQVADLASKLDTGVHTHLLETRVQARTPTPRDERSWVRVLDSVGLLTSRLSVAHAVWLSEQDMHDLAGRGVSIVHNPQSNLQLGSGIGQLHRWRRHGIPVALGTDGVNCGGSMDMLNSMRLAAIIHRPGLANPLGWESPWSVLDSATRGGANALSMRDLGSIAPGMRADLSVFETTGTAFATHEDSLASLVLSSYDHRARMVMVGGRIVVDDGQVTTVDERGAVEQAAQMHYAMTRRNSRYADLAQAQEGFLTQLSLAAAPAREIVSFEMPQEWEPSA